MGSITPGEGNLTSLTTLLKELSLPATKDNSTILQFLIDEKLPASKENIGMINELLKQSTSSNNSFAAIKVLLTQNLPITKTTFSAILSTIEGGSIVDSLHNLKTLLGKEGNLTESGERLLKLLSSITRTGKEEATLASIEKVLLQSSDEVIDGFQVLQKAVAHLQKTEDTSKNNDEHMVQERKEQPADRTQTIKASEADSPLAKGIEQVIGRGNASNVLEKLALLADQVQDDTALKNLFSEDEIKIIANLKEAIEAKEADFAEPETIVDQLKQTLKRLGFSYEQEIVQHFNKQSEHSKLDMDSLKPLLINVLNEHPTDEVKAASEQVLHKITGLQLLTHETGPMQQFAIEMPLQLWNQTVNLMMQWSGRKQENDQIDPSYCRVLFYLDLETIKELIIDMKVQAKVINLTIINDYESLKMITTPFIATLKENLVENGYLLSQVHFMTTADQNRKNQKKSNVYTNATTYAGVDFKI